MPRTLLISAMLDEHFPLLRYAFESKRYHPAVVLDQREGIEDLGLRFSHNDMCYPFALSLGQMLAALGSGRYDPADTAVLMPSAADACRGSNFPSLLRKAMEWAGYPEVEVLTLNVKGVEKGAALAITPAMVWKALFGLLYGDMLLHLTLQTRPYEKNPGETMALRQKWTDRLGEDLRAGRGLTPGRMKRDLRAMASDFAAVERTGSRRQRIALVGECYTKYCALGNWDLVAFLEEEGCEAAVNGFSWYMLYYFDSQRSAARGTGKLLWQGAMGLLYRGQRLLLSALRDHGFSALPDFPAFKEQAAPYVSFDLRVADGWLIGAEIVGHLRAGCGKVLAVQPFGCLPGHVCGRGQYPPLLRKLGKGRLVSVDVDASASRAMFYDRVKLLIDTEP